MKTCLIWDLVVMFSGMLNLLKSCFILLVFRFWKINAGLFPLLSFLARFVLCVPAASSKSERVFSVAGQVVTGKRASLGSEKVEDLVIMACNSRLINEFDV